MPRQEDFPVFLARYRAGTPSRTQEKQKRFLMKRGAACLQERCAAFWQAGPRCAEDGCVTPCEAADKGLAFYPPLLSQRYFAESERRRGGTGRGGTSRQVPYDGKRQGMKKAGEVSLSRRARSHSCGLSPRGIRTCIRTAERPSRRRHKKPDGTGHRCQSLRTHRRLRGRRSGSCRCCRWC